MSFFKWKKSTSTALFILGLSLGLVTENCLNAELAAEENKDATEVKPMHAKKNKKAKGDKKKEKSHCKKCSKKNCKKCGSGKKREERNKEQSEAQTNYIENRRNYCHRDLAFNGSIIAQSHAKIEVSQKRLEVVRVAISSAEKTCKNLRQKISTTKNKRKSCVEERRRLCRDRKKLLAKLKKDNQPQIEKQLDELTKKISAKIQERAQLTVEIQQLSRDIQGKELELGELKTEQKQLENTIHHLKKDIRKLEKNNENIKDELTNLKVEEQDKVVPSEPLTMF